MLANCQTRVKLGEGGRQEADIKVEADLDVETHTTDI
jgi:hypothetical protein